MSDNDKAARAQNLESQIDRLERSERDQPCEYGHGHCALVAGGRCSDEQLHALEARLMAAYAGIKV